MEFATPIAWTGFLLFTDYFYTRKKQKSFIFRREFLLIALSSIVLWWFFEWTNIIISTNWSYEKIPASLLKAYVGYFWSFATILPALLMAAELMKSYLFKDIKGPVIKFSHSRLGASFALGFIMFVIPLMAFTSKFITRAAHPTLFFWLPVILPQWTTKYMAALIWLFVIFLTEPLIYYINPRFSIYREIENGKWGTLLAVLTGGLLCGFLWEFWNFWAGTKWVYHVPILPQIKIFEMPILGYLGFPAFAWEMRALYGLVRTIFLGDSATE